MPKVQLRLKGNKAHQTSLGGRRFKELFQQDPSCMYSESCSLADEVSEPPEVKSCVLGYQRPSHTESVCLSIPVKLLQRKLPFYPEI